MSWLLSRCAFLEFQEDIEIFKGLAKDADFIVASDCDRMEQNATDSDQP